MPRTAPSTSAWNSPPGRRFPSPDEGREDRDEARHGAEQRQHQRERVEAQRPEQDRVRRPRPSASQTAAEEGDGDQRGPRDPRQQQGAPPLREDVREEHREDARGEEDRGEEGAEDRHGAT